MEKQYYEVGYFEEEPGRKSSTRLFSFLLLLFFFVLNGMYMAGIYQQPERVIDINFIVWDFVLLIGVFTPKYLHKAKEISKLIDTKKEKL